MRIASCLLVLCYGLIFFGFLQGQEDSVYQLSQVEIEAERIRENTIGSQVSRWEGKALRQFASLNLADFLQQEAGMYIKGYGLGSLSTSSIRGGNAGHTQVLWNGLPLQSPMLGQLDLALLPVHTAESIQFEKGGNTALWGSGAIGGLIAMDTEADFHNRLSLNSHTSLGSFGSFQQQLGLRLGNTEWQSHTKLSHYQARNDFLFEVAQGLPRRRQANAALSQQNLLQDFYWKPNVQNQFSLHLWRQESDREIPPTLVQNRSEARQEDAATRLIVEWERDASSRIFPSKGWII